MNNPQQEEEVTIMCAMCMKPINSYKVKLSEVLPPKNNKFICDNCYMEHAEPKGRIQ